MKCKKIAAFLMIVCLLVAFLPVKASAETVASGTGEGDLTWVLTDDGTLTISGNGDFDSMNYGWKEYKAQITSLVINEGATGAITDFFEYSSLRSVSLPSTITDIHRGAFAGCTSLSKINFPEGLKVIWSNAFYNCTSLTEVHLPASLDDFGARPFGACTNLTGIWMDSGNSKYVNDSRGVLYSKDMTQLIEAPGALSGSYVIPSTVDTISWAAFDGCRKLTAVNIPDGVGMIDMETFKNCRSFGEISIPGSVFYISNGAFLNCTSLSKITFIVSPTD